MSCRFFLGRSGRQAVVRTIEHVVREVTNMVENPSDIDICARCPVALLCLTGYEDISVDSTYTGRAIRAGLGLTKLDDWRTSPPLYWCPTCGKNYFCMCNDTPCEPSGWGWTSMKKQRERRAEDDMRVPVNCPMLLSDKNKNTNLRLCYECAVEYRLGSSR